MSHSPTHPSIHPTLSRLPREEFKVLIPGRPQNGTRKGYSDAWGGAYLVSATNLQLQLSLEAPLTSPPRRRIVLSGRGRRRGRVTGDRLRGGGESGSSQPTCRRTSPSVHLWGGNIVQRLVVMLKFPLVQVQANPCPTTMVPRLRINLLPPRLNYRHAQLRTCMMEEARRKETRDLAGKSPDQADLARFMTRGKCRKDSSAHVRRSKVRNTRP
ncbi:hypothetical protein QBC40DRAFT_348143 [Triangularia verruculosa]|uniref:Uncharacterized protein n=1 Tax=Triangularia verruculosa TaxID=2587418 RepID=A0AAN6XII9_9PEZI|nr:hypothetical protein QBC40DRAFT_348143 [Triangularia verruculosa]